MFNKEELILLPNKETQIKALLWGDAYDLACNTLEVSTMKNSRYSDVFTVSTVEVVEYVLKHGIPENEMARREQYVEGFHFLKENGKWKTFFYERGITSYEKNFEDDTEAKKYIALTLIQLAGTGLY